jgi:hypothetical protein
MVNEWQRGTCYVLDQVGVRGCTGELKSEIRLWGACDRLAGGGDTDISRGEEESSIENCGRD